MKAKNLGEGTSPNPTRRDKERPIRRLLFWGGISLFAHLFAFYLFQVMDPVSKTAQRPVTALFLWQPDTKEGGGLSDLVIHEDPAFFSRPPTPTSREILDAISLDPAQVFMSETQP